MGVKRQMECERGGNRAQNRGDGGNELNNELDF